MPDHEPYIAGMIFLATEWSARNAPEAVKGVYSLNGIWNTAWDGSHGFGSEAAQAARQIFEQLCHAWNDIADSRSASLPTQ
jgi:hypothetical protein